MSSDTSDGGAISFEEIAAKMGLQRRSILALLVGGDDASENRLNSREVRQAAGGSADTVRNHLRRLEEHWELIEVVDREQTRAGGAPAKVFGLTDRGRQYLGSPQAEADAEPDYSHLTDDTRDLEARVEQLESKVDGLESELQMMRESFDELKPIIIEELFD